MEHPLPIQFPSSPFVLVVIAANYRNQHPSGALSRLIGARRPGEGLSRASGKDTETTTHTCGSVQSNHVSYSATN